MARQQPAAGDGLALWFNQADDGNATRRALTRERVAAEALAVIAADGAQALSMRALATRLGVVPGALYRHVHGKEQLYDLILDAVLGEVDCRTDPAAALDRAGRRPRAAACGRSWKTTRASPPCSRPATPSAPRRWPWPRRSSRRCTRPDCPAARLPWPSASSTTTPSASPSPIPHRPPNSACATPRPGSNCTTFLRALPASRFPNLAAHGIHAWDCRPRRALRRRPSTPLLRGLQADQRPVRRQAPGC